MATVILVRHGETDWNRDKIFRGRADIPLSGRGLQQAERVGAALGNCRLEAIYTSPLRRSLQTAEAIAAHQNAAPVTVNEITDIDYGDWQGKSQEEIAAAFPEMCALWESAPEKVRIPGGESLAEVRTRSLPAILDLADGAAGSIAVVSHRVVLKVVILGLLGLGVEGFWRLKLDTCGISVFETSAGRSVLTRFNDVSHLQGLCGADSADF